MDKQKTVRILKSALHSVSHYLLFQFGHTVDNFLSQNRKFKHCATGKTPRQLLWSYCLPSSFPCVVSVDVSSFERVVMTLQAG